jgi:hypothetical protein
MKVIETLHEGRLVEEVKHLTTVELDRIDEVHCVISRRHEISLGGGRITLTVPPKIIERAVKGGPISRWWLSGQPLVHDGEDLAIESPIR